MNVDPNWIPESLMNRRAAGARWASFGPYYAMFPITFARSVIDEWTQLGDGVLDPFAGRGTSLFCACEVKRHAFGAEINPLGWIYARTKLSPAPQDLVAACIEQIGTAAKWFAGDADKLPVFFHYCFSSRVRAFLLAARMLLKWRTRGVDRTTMAFILTYLHGKIERGRPSSLSNQMRQTKAMAPDYSVAWWIENGLATPPDLDPIAFLLARVEWRYQKGAPNWHEAGIGLGDCRTILSRRPAAHVGRFQLLLTSPPYRGVTSYYYDQWLRFWLLGEPAHPVMDGQRWKTKFDDGAGYRALIRRSFSASRRLLSNDAVIYVRTDARPGTLDPTRDVLQDLFPDKRHDYVPAPYNKATQTSLFGDRTYKPGEVDIIITPR